MKKLTKKQILTIRNLETKYGLKLLSDDNKTYTDLMYKALAFRGLITAKVMFDMIMNMECFKTLTEKEETKDV